MVARDVPFSVTLTPTGATAKSTFTDSFSDPETGFTYKSRETRVYNFATVQGALDWSCSGSRRLRRHLLGAVHGTNRLIRADHLNTTPR